MGRCLNTAMGGLKRLSHRKKAIVEIEIQKIISTKVQLERIARQKGYSDACKSSIPICRGGCCKWHFPRNLTHVDFFIAIFFMSKEKKDSFAGKILDTKGRYCPVLLDTGCFLTFEERPIACTNAYPCYMDRSYWMEKEKKNIIFKKCFSEISAMVSF